MFVQNETGMAYYEDEEQHNNMLRLVTAAEVYMEAGYDPSDAEQLALFDNVADNLLKQQGLQKANIYPSTVWGAN